MICGNCHAPHLREIRDERTGEVIEYECCFCGWATGVKSFEEIISSGNKDG